MEKGQKRRQLTSILRQKSHVLPGLSKLDGPRKPSIENMVQITHLKKIVNSVRNAENQIFELNHHLSSSQTSHYDFCFNAKHTFDKVYFEGYQYYQPFNNLSTVMGKLKTYLQKIRERGENLNHSQNSLR